MTKLGAVSARYTNLRIFQFAAAETVLLIGLAVVFHGLPSYLVWPLTLGLIVPTLFAEPYFTGPRTALATALGQVAGYFSSSSRSLERNLWTLLLVVSALVAVSALIAIARHQGPGQLFHWIATRVGRAFVLGSITVLILILQVSRQHPGRASATGVVVLVVYFILFLDWARLTFGPSRLLGTGAAISAVVAPNQILVRSVQRLTVGTAVTLSGSEGAAAGIVAEELASDRGSQYRVTLHSHWRTVTDGTDSPCTLEIAPDDPTGTPRGFAIQGSTESSLRVNPIGDLSIGETMELSDRQGPLLYQVSGLRLEEASWAGGAAIVPRASLVQVAPSPRPA